MLTDYGKQKILEHQTGTAWSAPTYFAAVSSTVPAANGTNVTEPSTGGYARITTSGKWGAYSGGQVQNNAAISFAESTGSWLSGADLLCFCLYDAVSAGNLVHYDFIGRTAGNDQYFLANQGVNTTTDVITTLSTHGWSSGQQVVVRAMPGATLPTGVSANTRYWANVLSTTTLELHTAAALNARVDITAVGAGTALIFGILPRNVTATGTTLLFNSGSLTLRLTDL